ncbi:MAG: glycosyltransferase family 2 protein [Holophagaceae bacterium]|nr:glycosyltransferase family 2 protein [Holophagaceae bacterium]
MPTASPAEGLPDLAVVLVIREKFSLALECLRRICAETGPVFTLRIVDCGYPAPVRAAMEAFLAGRPRVVWIESPRPLLPGEALNLALASVREPLLCQIQNDVLIEPGFLARMVATQRETGCDIVAPLTLDLAPGGEAKPHRDEGGGTLGIFEREPDGRVAIFERRRLPEEAGRIRVHRFETHALLLRTEALRALGPLPALNSREHLDLALRAWNAGCRVLFEPRAVATYVLAPIHRSEVAFFRFRWDLALARRSHAEVKAAWRIRRMPRAMAFVARHRALLEEARVLPDPDSVGCGKAARL